MPPNVQEKSFINTDDIPYNDKPKTEEKEEEEAWVCPASAKSMRTINPIRAIVDPIVANSIKCGKERDDGKDQISLALGDPSAYPNLQPCPTLINAAIQSAQSPLHRGYINACGSSSARSAIAKFHSTSSYAISPDDIIIASGCSGALELAITGILDDDTCILVPKPGFPLYQVIAESHGAYVKHYDLKPSQNWECDLHHMEELILQERSKLRAILINNPSNPCGAVFSKQHLREILQLAERYKLLVISDEVYGDMTFGDAVFHPMGEVAAEMGNNVPVITASGLGKQFLVPGWRVGWLILQDCEQKALHQVKQGIKNLSQVVLGASHLIQGAIPSILDPSPSNLPRINAWKHQLHQTLSTQSDFTSTKLQKCHGLTVIPSSGAMYCMVQIHIDKFRNIKNDLDFTKKLLEEKNVFVLPGTAFGVENFFRVVYCAPVEVLGEAFERIDEFCWRYADI